MNLNLENGLLSTLDARIQTHRYELPSDSTYFEQAKRICEDDRFQAMMIVTPLNAVLHEDDPTRHFPEFECCIGADLAKVDGTLVENSQHCSAVCTLCTKRPPCAEPSSAYTEFVSSCGSAITKDVQRFMIYGYQTHGIGSDLPNLISYGMTPVKLATLTAARLLTPSAEDIQRGLSDLTAERILQERTGYANVVYVAADASSADRLTAYTVRAALARWDDVRAPLEPTRIVFDTAPLSNLTASTRLVVVGDYSAQIANDAGANVYLVVSNADSVPFALDSITTPAFSAGREIGVVARQYIASSTAPSDMNVVLQESKASCRCISWNEVSHYMDPVANDTHFDVVIDGVPFSYERPYGFGGCDAWDANRPPVCDQASPPGFCSDQWCYVTSDCATGIETDYFKYWIDQLPNNNDRLLYSYEHCGALDSFTTSGTPYTNAATREEVVQARTVISNYTNPSTENIVPISVANNNTLVLLVDLDRRDDAMIQEAFVLAYDGMREYQEDAPCDESYSIGESSGETVPACPPSAPPLFKPACRCLGYKSSVLKTGGVLNGLWTLSREPPYSYTNDDSLPVTFADGKEAEYDRRYGFDQCDAHDSNRVGCDPALFDCEARWCYVNPDCQRSSLPTSYFSAYFNTLDSNKNLYYSYEFCSAKTTATFTPFVLPFSASDPTEQAELMVRACTTPNIKGFAMTVASFDPAYHVPLQTAIDYCKTYNRMARYPITIVNTMTFTTEAAYVGTSGGDVGRQCARKLSVDETERAFLDGLVMTPSKALKPLRRLAVYVPDAEGMAELRYRGFVQEMAALYGANATAAQIRRCSTLIELARAALQDGFDAIVKMTSDTIPLAAELSCSTVQDINAAASSGVDVYSEGAQAWTTLVSEARELRVRAALPTPVTIQSLTAFESKCTLDNSTGEKSVFNRTANTVNGTHYFIDFGGDESVHFDASYGINCAAHDNPINPLCQVDGDKPQWCESNWTYVQYQAGCTSYRSFYLTPKSGQSIYYSYAQCGAQDYFTSKIRREFIKDVANVRRCTSDADCGSVPYDASLDPPSLTSFDPRGNFSCVDQHCVLSCGSARLFMEETCHGEIQPQNTTVDECPSTSCRSPGALREVHDHLAKLYRESECCTASSTASLNLYQTTVFLNVRGEVITEKTECEKYMSSCNIVTTPKALLSFSPKALF